MQAEQAEQNWIVQMANLAVFNGIILGTKLAILLYSS